MVWNKGNFLCVLGNMRLTGVRGNDRKSKEKGMILKKKGNPGKAKTKRSYEAKESRASVEGVL